MVLTAMEATDGIASLDISDPLNPKVLDTVGAHPFYYATCFDGRKLYTSVRGNGARMTGYDLSDRSRFVAEDNRLVINEQLYCATQDHHVFQGAQYRIHKVDVSNPMQHVEIGHEFRMHLDPVQRLRPAKLAVACAKTADEFLDAGIDVGAVEGGDTGVREGDHVGDGIVAAQAAVAGSHLPAAADNPRDLVVRRQSYPLHVNRLRAARPSSRRG